MRGNAPRIKSCSSMQGRSFSRKRKCHAGVRPTTRSFVVQGAFLGLAVGLGMLLTCCAAERKPRKPAVPVANTNAFWPTSTCRGCHDQIVEQHLASSHEMSFTNPAFQAQYRRDILPRAPMDPQIEAAARECIACHEPISYATKGPGSVSLLEIDSKMNGVTCDVCHTMTGFREDKPQNGNYVLEPGDRKLGPFKGPGDWHHIYSELQTKSEICAVCHEAVNRHGLRIKASFTEWRESAFAQKGVQCQDCHMNVDGFLTAGMPRFASGKAAEMSLGSAPQRERLYTHQFPGAHSRTQIEGAIALVVEALPPNNPQSPSRALAVTVDNSRTGHSMPSGSADLRLLWMEVTIRVGDDPARRPAILADAGSADDANAYARAGLGKFDTLLLGSEVPKGSRIYRAIFTDASGQATLDSYNAVAIYFDNRLKAAEKRRELYQYTIPEGVAGDVIIQATLKYLPYSSTFTKRFGLPLPEAVVVAQREIRLGAENR